MRVGSSARDAALIAAAVAAGRVTVSGGAVPAPAADVSEAVFTRQVIDLARAAGWLVAHFGPARVLRNGVEKYETPVRGDGKGFPDIVLARGGVVRLVELKAAKGVLSDAQRRWVRESGAAVWRPDQWELIVETLGGQV